MRPGIARQGQQAGESPDRPPAPADRSLTAMNALTIADLLLPGEPLDPSDVLAGEARLRNAVSWAVSLRPFPPAFPRLRGGELALVAGDFLTRLDPPLTLAEVVRHLASRGAAGLAVRGHVDQQAIEEANECGLPLVQLQSDTPLPDIEQAVMRVCALYQARSEVLPGGPDNWLDDLLAGRTGAAEARQFARREGRRLASAYSVVFVAAGQAGEHLHEDDEPVAGVLGALESGSQSNGFPVLWRPWEDGLALLVPQGSVEWVSDALVAAGLPGGVGTERPVAEVVESLSEARLAALSSMLLCGREPVAYADMGADRLLILLYRDRPDDLRGFVQDTLGPLLRHDASSPAPLLPTLASFVTHGGRLRETASDIFVHRNTLAYRLDRAAEVLGADLKDPAARLAIELALRALPLVRTTEEKRGANGNG